MLLDQMACAKFLSVGCVSTGREIETGSTHASVCALFIVYHFHLDYLFLLIVNGPTGGAYADLFSFSSLAHSLPHSLTGSFFPSTLNFFAVVCLILMRGF